MASQLSAPVIVILDCGMGNPGSVHSMCARLGIDAVVSSEREELMRATKIILPGVGHFSRFVENLDASGLRVPLTEKVRNQRTPILGICMGMQVMTERSEEGAGGGLGWVRATTRRFSVVPDERGRMPKVPNMGWSYVTIERPHPLLENLPAEPRFYFVHSYWVDYDDAGAVLMRSRYGGQTFCAAFALDNIVGVQFHVEKSHVFGMRMLRNFADWRAPE